MASKRRGRMARPEEVRPCDCDAFEDADDVDDFEEWVERPIVYRLNHDMLDACHRHLAGKRKPRTASDLVGELFSDGYTVFSECELVEALRADARFIVESAEGWVLADIRVRRPGSKRKLPSGLGRPGEPGGN